MAPSAARPLLLASALAALALAAAGCSSDYRYVNNSAEQTFFRLPAGVEVFRIRTEQPTDRPAPLDLSSTDTWNVIFDGAAEASPDHFDDAAPADIVGQASIIPVGAETSEGLSVKQARAALAGGSDPIEAAQSGDAGVEIVSFETISDGARNGSRVVFNQEVEDGVWTTFDQTSLIDVAARKVYFFEVKCESSCFKDNRDQISQIVDSWQVRT